MDRTDTASNSLLLTLVISLCFFFLSFESALAAQARLAWNQSTDSSVIGYKVYHGEESRNYTVVEDVQANLTSLVAWTAGTQPRYFAVTAYSSTSESDFSEELTCHLIKATTASNGTISPSGETVLVKGSSQTFSITPSTGYVIKDLVIDGTSVGALSSYTFTDVSANHTVSATFAPIAPVTYTITASSTSGGTISPSGSTVVNQGSSKAFTITPNTNYKISDVTVDGTSVGAVSSYTFSNITADHTIAATFVPITYTITASSTSGGAISPSGATVVNQGSSKAFTITPNTNYKISDVTVDGTSVGAVSSYTFSNVTGDHTISATFALITIIASSTSGGTISPSGSIVVKQGRSKAFTITPNTDYRISDVTVDGTSVGVVTSYTFSNVTTDHTIEAAFALITHTITASTTSGGTISPSGSTMVNKGSSKSFAITPDTNYKISDVKVDGTSVGAVASYTFSNVSADHTISATFALTTYTITANAQTGGTISPSGSTAVNQGTSKVFTITPTANYKIDDVKVDGTSIGALSSYTFSNVTADHTIFATFAPITCTITASAESGGAISPAGVISVNKGASKTFTIVPATNYRISDVKVDGTSVGTPSSYTFSNVISDKTISAAFRPEMQIVVDKQSVMVREGNTSTFSVKLSSKPANNVVVSADWLAGDPDISIISGSALTFTPKNWRTYQTVILGAAPDADMSDGSATIRLSAANMDHVDVTATESDEGQCETLLTLQDINRNGSSEVAVLQKDFSTQANDLYIKDTKTRSLLTKVSFDPALTPRGLVSYRTGGSQKVAMLGKNSSTGMVQVEVRDALTGHSDNVVTFSGVPVPKALAVIRDLNRNGTPELAVLGLNTSTGNVRVQIRDSVTGNLLKNIAFDSNFAPKAMAVISDDKNQLPRIAVLGINPSTGATRAELKNTSGALIRTISFNRSYSPLSWTKVPGLNANGGSGLSLLGIKPTTRKTTAQLMDSELGSLVKMVSFGSSAIPRSFAVMESIDKNPGRELGLLQINRTTGKFSAVRKDAKTGTSLSSVPFSKNYMPVALTVVADLNANGSPELASLGVNKSTGKVRLELRDGESKKAVKAIAIP